MSADGADTRSDNRGTSTSDDKATEGKTFTEAEMKQARESADRRYRKKYEAELQTAKDGAVSSLISDLELESVDELRDLITAHREGADKQDTAASELRKLQRQLNKITSERDSAVTQLGELTKNVEAATTKDAILAVAEKIGAYGEEIYALIQQRHRVGVDMDGQAIVHDANGDPAEETIEQVVKDLVADRPHLQKATGGVGSGSLPGNPNNVQSGAPKLLTREEIVAEMTRQGLFKVS